MEIEEKPERCANCRRELHQGVDVVAAQQGVMGPRGLVPLDDPMLFCCDACLAEYYAQGEAVVMKRRLP